MRKHLLECLKHKKMDLFPVLKTQRVEMKIKCEDFIVYCKCRMPEIVGVDMVQCSKCSEWFHAPYLYNGYFDSVVGGPNISVRNKFFLLFVSEK